MHGDKEGRGIREDSNEVIDVNVDLQPPSSSESLPSVKRIERTKIVLVGDKSVGKSALIDFYSKDTFSDVYESKVLAVQRKDVELYAD